MLLSYLEYMGDTEYKGSNWRNLLPLDKARYFASVGDVNTVRSYYAEGVFGELSEFEQRKIIAQAYTKAAKLREEQASQGLYSKKEWEDSNLAEAGANLPRDYRAKALEILYNPEGKSLEDQLK